MSSTEKPQAQLPTNAIQRHFSKLADGWFEYIVRVHPHHTDYGGVVWHGTYIAWMEEARVESLRGCTSILKLTNNLPLFGNG